MIRREMTDAVKNLAAVPAQDARNAVAMARKPQPSTAVHRPTASHALVPRWVEKRLSAITGGACSPSG